MKRRNVLIYHTGALGDFVLTFPLAMALGRLFAQSRIIYITHHQKGVLAEQVLRVESTDVEGGWHQLFSDAPKLSESAGNLLAAAHSVFTFLPRADEIWVRNVQSLDSKISVIRLDPRPPADYRGHFTDFLVEQLGDRTAVQASVIAMIRTLNERGTLSTAKRSDTIVIHPGSGGEHKCWPKQKFIQLIHRLCEASKPVRVLLGETELEKWSREQISHFEKAAQVVTPATLLELHENLSTAAAVVMNDSGPAHLAGVIGTPSVVLFGPSAPGMWRPLGPRVEIIAANPLESIEVSQVYDKLTQLL